MNLKVKFLKWSAGVPVVMLNYQTAEKLGVHPNDRILIKTLEKEPKEIFSVVGVVESLARKKEIAVSSEAGNIIELKNGQRVNVSLASTPKSLEFIKKKLNGERLMEPEIKEIIKDVVNNSLSGSEIALFVSAMYNRGMNLQETIDLIKSMKDVGCKINFPGKFVVDKHCIGGIAGNRTTPIIVSICASAGLIFPKTSSRAITSAAGTADVVETLAKVEFSIKNLEKILKKTKACFIAGGFLGIVPSDSKIIQIEKLLNIDPKSQLVASIMSKKIAMGAKYLLIDIPFGEEAKVKNKREAVALKKKFELIGKHFGKKIKCVITNGRQPIGNGIGPVLEMRDILRVLDRAKKGPEDLEKKSIYLAGEIFDLVGKTRKGKGICLAREILYSGKAFEKFKEILKAQGGCVKDLKLGKYKKEIFAKNSGRVRSIKNKKISLLGRVAGCPLDKSAGVYLQYHLGEKVNKKDKILTIYAESKPRLKQAVKFWKDNKNIIEIK